MKLYNYASVNNLIYKCCSFLDILGSAHFSKVANAFFPPLKCFQLLCDVIVYKLPNAKNDYYYFIICTDYAFF